MAVELNYRKQKAIMKQALLLFQLEMWKNELTLDADFMELVERKKIEIPPNLGTGMILFKACKIIDPQLFESIRKESMIDGMKAISAKWGVPDTEEDREEFIVAGAERKIEVPENLIELAEKIQKGKLTAEDIIEPPRIDKSVKEQAHYKVEKDNFLEEPKLKKVVDGKVAPIRKRIKGA